MRSILFLFTGEWTRAKLDEDPFFQNNLTHKTLQWSQGYKPIHSVRYLDSIPFPDQEMMG
jgi:hypothetical protein